ncbi:MAG: hypothetical protein ACR2RF_25030 [Geminicoccaceae bacterium]
MSSLYMDDGPTASGQKVMLATTAYDSPDASYTFSIQRSREALREEGIQSAYLLLSGNCHVDDARNNVVQQFLLSDCTDLVFIDADVSWRPEALVELCKYSCDLVGGVYPFRRPDLGSMPVRMIHGVTEPVDGLLEVEGLPSGFMRIRRHVMEKLAKTAKCYQNKTERRSKVPILFERAYSRGSRIGGDINFCLKWRASGGKVHAAYEMQLGHSAKTIVRDSLGAALRRQSDTTLQYVAERIRAGKEDPSLFHEARSYSPNPYGALEDVLALAVLMARKADGPILETGSGLSTILMAAATDQTVWCLEHDYGWAAQVENIAHKAGTLNIAVCTYRLKDGWYDITDDLPERFSLGLHDGPPRRHGGRMAFFEHMADRCDTLVIDDADDPGYSRAIEAWSAKKGRKLDFIEDRAALIRRDEDVPQETLQGRGRPLDQTVGRHGRVGLVQDEGRGLASGQARH